MARKEDHGKLAKTEFILYTTEDGKAEIRLRVADETVWLTQAEIAELFGTSKQNVSLHLKNIFEEGEQSASATVKESLTVQTEGSRQVERSVAYYNLDAILSVGYRVKGPRGTQFRQWATVRLREFLVKGFTMDDQRLMEPGGWDYFDELLERIRRIRASEKRFYQKIRDLYTTAVDYDSKSESAQLFFKKVQNKMLWSATGMTAAEIIAARSNPDLPNMGLTAFKGNRVLKQDVTVSKNYLSEAELADLDRIVVMYLEYAEDQARRRRTVTMQEWEDKLDTFLTFNERELLTHAGKVTHEVAEKLAAERYDKFDSKRRLAERNVADAQDLVEIESLERSLEARKEEGHK